MSRPAGGVEIRAGTAAEGRAPAARPATIREWLGSDPFPWPAVHELRAGTRVAGCYYVESRQLRRTRQDKPYLRLKLCDRSGALEGRVWDDADRIHDLVPVGSFVGVRGRLEDRKSTRLNSSHVKISYAVFCLKKKKTQL